MMTHQGIRRIWILSVGSLVIGILGIFAIFEAVRSSHKRGWDNELRLATSLAAAGAIFNLGGLLIYILRLA